MTVITLTYNLFNKLVHWALKRMNLPTNFVKRECPINFQSMKENDTYLKSF